MSKYQDLYNTLRQDIAQGKWKVGSLIPSETVLMKTYEVGRETARKAVNLLAQDGLIQKEHGKGSRLIATDVPERLYDLAAYPYIPSNPGLDTIVKDVKLIQPTREISRNLGQKSKHKVWKITRIRTVDDHPAALETDYVDIDMVPNLNIDRAEAGSWELAKEKTGLDISYSRKEITMKPASAKEAQILQVKEGTLLAVVRSWTFLEDTTQLQYTVAKHNPELFLYKDFIRSKKSL